VKKLESWFTLNAPPVVFVDVCLERWIAPVVGWCRHTVASGLGGRATLPGEKSENRPRRPRGAEKRRSLANQAWLIVFFDRENSIIVLVGEQTEERFAVFRSPTKTIISFVNCGSYFF
jgi:hypothetical protein